MEIARPTLVININVSCPHCEYFIELLAETDLNKEGDLLNMALPDGPWVDEHEKFECEITCPKCKQEFLAKGLEW